MLILPDYTTVTSLFPPRSPSFLADAQAKRILDSIQKGNLLFYSFPLQQ